MKIYCAFGGWHYEGNNNPKYVGHDFEAAKAALNYQGYDFRKLQVWEDERLLETIQLERPHRERT